MSELPAGWTLGAVGRILRIQYGQALPERSRDSRGRIPVYGSAGRIGYHSSSISNGPAVVIGRKGHVGAAYLEAGPSWPIDTTYFAEIPGGLNPAFVAYQLQAMRLRDLDSSTAVPSLRREDLEAQLLAIAPKLEQERIVAAIDERFSRLNFGVAALERARMNLRRIRAAVLDAAVPPADGLRTLKVALGDLVRPDRKIAYGVLVPGDDDPDGIPFVRVGDLIDRRVATRGLKHIAPAVAARYPRTRLQGGEVLLSLVGTIGRTAVVPQELAGANAARALAVIPVREDVEPRYVAIALGRHGVTRDLTALSHEVARKTLNLEDVRRYEIPLPGYSEQLEIVKAVDTQETWIRSVEDVFARVFRRADQLRASVLQAAFSGQLVSQDESDEVAPALLASIAAEPGSANGHRTTRRSNRRPPLEGSATR